MSCSVKYNCCQLADLCPKNKTCKPFNAPTKPWKRFTCECRDGYYGENCDKPIRSCAGYLNMYQESGKYQVVDSQNSEYDVYCHFDSDFAWTLVQSYNFANGSHNGVFSKPLWEDFSVSENALEWTGYRLSKPRMESIKSDSTFLQFTCDYENHHQIAESDYVQINFRSISEVDVLTLQESTSPFTVRRGKIGEYNISLCRIQLRQDASSTLNIHFEHLSAKNSRCVFNTDSCSYNMDFFGRFHHYNSCKNEYKHRCAQRAVTTQLWFGMRNP